MLQLHLGFYSRVRSQFTKVNTRKKMTGDDRAQRKKLSWDRLGVKYYTCRNLHWEAGWISTFTYRWSLRYLCFHLQLLLQFVNFPTRAPSPVLERLLHNGTALATATSSAPSLLLPAGTVAPFESGTVGADEDQPPLAETDPYTNQTVTSPSQLVTPFGSILGAEIEAQLGTAEPGRFLIDRSCRQIK